MRKYLLGLIEKIESTPLSLGSWVVTFFSIVCIRFMIEKYLVNFSGLTVQSSFFTLAHYFLEFLFVALLFMLIIRFAGADTHSRAAQFTLFGFLLIWTPPLSDFVILHNPGVFSLYEFGTLPELGKLFISFFDDTPEIGITYGIRIEIAIAVLMITLYSYLKRASVPRALMSGLFTYAMLFVVSTFPSWLTLLFLGPEKGWLTVGEHESVQLFLSPTPIFGQVVGLMNAAHFKMSLVYGFILPLFLTFLFALYFRHYFLPLYKNVRLPQMIYHGGLFLLGGLLSLVYEKTSFSFDLFHLLGLLVMIIAVECAWLATVVINDFMDEETDRITNPHRPLPSGSIPRPLYRTFGMLFFFSSIFLSLLISIQVALLLLAYHALAWLYSAWPLRLKRFPIVATGVSSAASLLVFFAGYIIFTADKNIEELPWHIPAYLFFAYTLLLPIKDFKDIAGDRVNGVFTLPVLLGEQWAKRFLGSALFALFIGSVFLLHIERLFPLALFFGSLAYWILHLSSPDHKYFTYRSLAAWFMALASAYGFFLLLALL